MPIRWATTSARLAGLVIVLVATAGCGSRPQPVSAAGAPAAQNIGQTELARGCPPGGARAAVDYVDFLQANGRQYISGLSGKRLVINPADVGPVALQVQCSFAAANDATGRDLGMPRDGDAAFLAPGTKVYEVRGWSPLCRLAAMHDGALQVYLAYRPDAKVATPEPCALSRR